MLRISYKEFLKIRKTISIGNLERQSKYYRGTLLSILIQKKIESVKKNYHIFANKSEEILDFWEKTGKIPRMLGLTPIIKIRIILKAMGYGKNRIKKILMNPQLCDDENLSREVYSAVLKDYVYSPLAAELQMARGKMGEKILKSWLECMNVEYKTEKFLKRNSRKTPDFLIEEHFDINGRTVSWIESKSMFGDPRTHELLFKKQYKKYTEMFGDGIAIYWLGYVNGLKNASAGEFISSNLRDNLLEMKVILMKKEPVKSRSGDIVVSLNDKSADGVEIKELMITDQNEIDCSKIIKGFKKLFSLFSLGRLVILCDNYNFGFIKEVLRNYGFALEFYM